MATYMTLKDDGSFTIATSVGGSIQPIAKTDEQITVIMVLNAMWEKYPDGVSFWLAENAPAPVAVAQAVEVGPGPESPVEVKELLDELAKQALGLDNDLQAVAMRWLSVATEEPEHVEHEDEFIETEPVVDEADPAAWLERAIAITMATDSD